MQNNLLPGFCPGLSAGDGGDGDPARVRRTTAQNAQKTGTTKFRAFAFSWWPKFCSPGRRGFGVPTALPPLRVRFLLVGGGWAVGWLRVRHIARTITHHELGYWLLPGCFCELRDAGGPPPWH